MALALCPILLNRVRIARKLDDRVVFSLLAFEFSTELDVVVAAVVVVVVSEVGGGGVANEVSVVVVVVGVCSLSMRSLTSC